MSIIITSDFDLVANLPLRKYTTVLDSTARDAIPSSVRHLGFETFLTSTNQTYQLQNGVTNSDWVDITSGGGGAITGTGSFTRVGLWSSASNMTFDNDLTMFYGTPEQGLNSAYGVSIGNDLTITRYVNPTTGTDSPGSGTDVSDPYRTIPYACRQIHAVGASTYILNLAVGTPGSPVIYNLADVITACSSIGNHPDPLYNQAPQTIEIIGDNSDPTLVEIRRSQDTIFIARDLIPTLKFTGVTFVNPGSLTVASIGIRAINSHITLENCNFTGITYPILAEENATVTVINGCDVDTARDVLTAITGARITADFAGTWDQISGFGASVDSDARIQMRAVLTANAVTADFPFIRAANGGTFNLSPIGGGASVLSLDSFEEYVSVFNGGTYICEDEGVVFNLNDFTRVADIRSTGAFIDTRGGGPVYNLTGTSTNDIIIVEDGYLYTQTSFNILSEQTSDVILGTDYRYPVILTFVYPGKLPPGQTLYLTASGKLTPQQISVFQPTTNYNIYGISMSSRVGNGATATDNYYVYLDGAFAGVAAVVTNNDEGSDFVPSEPITPANRVQIVIESDATTTAEDITVQLYLRPSDIPV